MTPDVSPDYRVGTAGWSIPRASAERAPGDGTHLQRYARVLACSEINSSFHRSHRAAVYAKWAASTPSGFRFSVKLPRAITHDLFSQQRSSGWTFDAEVLFIAHRVSHLPIVEVPVVWSPRGVSRVRPLAAAISGLALFGTAWNRVRGAYRPVLSRTIDQPRPATIES